MRRDLALLAAVTALLAALLCAWGLFDLARGC